MFYVGYKRMRIKNAMVVKFTTIAPKLLLAEREIPPKESLRENFSVPVYFNLINNF
jgi:hypothetical protein